MEPKWFELEGARRRNLTDQVWIPLRMSEQLISQGRRGHLGFKQEYCGTNSVAVPKENREKADGLGWEDLGLSQRHVGYADKNGYKPVEICWHNDWDEVGIALVLAQGFNCAESSEWHLNQDFVFSLKLLREGNLWVAPNEGYTEVARLRLDNDNYPIALEVKKSFLSDYLAAREMNLYIVSYRSRKQTVEDADHIPWPEGRIEEEKPHCRFQARVTAIHEGGFPYGGKKAVFQAVRTNVDSEADVPVINTSDDDEFETRSSVFGEKGKKLYQVEGELWREEWIEHDGLSVRIRGDRDPAVFQYFMDSAGKIETAENLTDTIRYLWFRPEVIMNLSHRRGGSLDWISRETGRVKCSPDYDVHFGVNDLGFINVLANDVSDLPAWQQRIWSGDNIVPEGGVSKEIKQQQLEGLPTNSKAPEQLLAGLLIKLDFLFLDHVGPPAILHHNKLPELVSKCHRFRSISDEGLLVLAKDVSRLLADNLNRKAFQKIAPPPESENWASLKSMEKALAYCVGEEKAAEIMKPIFGIHELRQADAHISSDDLNESYKKIGITEETPSIGKGLKLLDASVTALMEVIAAFEKELR